MVLKLIFLAQVLGPLDHSKSDYLQPLIKLANAIQALSRILADTVNTESLTNSLEILIRNFQVLEKKEYSSENQARFFSALFSSQFKHIFCLNIYFT